MDRDSAEGILQLLQMLNREQGKTIVMVTHDPLAANYATRIVHMDKGPGGQRREGRMKYLILIWAGLWRKKTRTILTMLSIIVAFPIVRPLQGINQGMSHVFASLNVDRLYIQSRISMSDGLPISYLARIKSVPACAP